VLDLPQLYTKPSAHILLSTLADLSVQPLSWERVPQSGNEGSEPQRRKRKINNEGVPQYLTKIISSPLVWIEDDAEKEQIWEVASQRLSERSGRTAMGAITRSFAIPISLTVPSNESREVPTSSKEPPQDCDENNMVQLTLYEPPMTADNLGLKTWASSYLLAKQLCSLQQRIPDLAPNAAILELGAGTGLVGMAAALVFKRHTILTDLPEIVPNLEQNARSNSEVISSCGGSVSAAVLDWTRPDELELDGFNGSPNSFPLIVVADPIYSSDHPRMLVDAIRHHLSEDQSARLVIELPLRDAYADERQDLKDRLAEIGIRIVEQGEEVGYDDWSAGQGEELSEVKCWWGIWAQQ
jgi:predicted nicotinamide N-methyase